MGPQPRATLGKASILLCYQLIATRSNHPVEPDRFPPIIVPAHWDAQQDFAYFDERWSTKATTYTEALWRMMSFHCSCFMRTLDGSLHYFQVKNWVALPTDPRCLTPAEKIEILRDAARSSPALAQYRERLLEDLEGCARVEHERQRVLREHRLAGEQAWMYPVIELIDYLGDMAAELEETMHCELEDYRMVAEEFFDGASWYHMGF